MYYYGARYYNPSIGRFMSEDPSSRDTPEKFLSDPQGLNFYAYARNNPLRYIDPTGNSFEETRNYMNYGLYVSNKQISQYERISMEMEKRGGLNWTSPELGKYYMERSVDKKFGEMAPCFMWVMCGEQALDPNSTDPSKLSEEELYHNREVIADRGADFGMAVAGMAGGGIGSAFDKTGKLTKAAINESVTIAGQGSRKSLNQAQRLAEQYGGKTSDWAKKTTQEFTSPTGQQYQVHFYQNLVENIIVEAKTKLK